MLEVICPYCARPAVLTDSAVVYGRTFGMVWLCTPCDAWVGCHKNSKNHKPLGRLANKELRHWKVRAHAAFDPLWKRKMMAGSSKGKARNAGYKWLAKRMGIKERDCHIGMFDVEQCRQAVKICGPYNTRRVSC